MVVAAPLERYAERFARTHGAEHGRELLRVADAYPVHIDHDVAGGEAGRARDGRTDPVDERAVGRAKVALRSDGRRGGDGVEVPQAGHVFRRGRWQGRG